MNYGKIATLLLLLSLAAMPCRGDGKVWLIDVKGAIGPATSDHMIRALEAAEAEGAGLAILRIDTPGGLDTAMRKMIKSILAARIPVVAYVAPGGARAASAGTYILYASHIAAMAPGTNLGAATPVQIGGPSLPELPDQGQEGESPEKPKPASAMERKIVNDAVAYIQSLAQMRGRNPDWAEDAVRTGASLSAEDALSLGVIEILASSEQDLLQQLHGRQLTIEGVEQTLETENATIYEHPIDWRSEFLAVITDPNVAYMLMLIGIYGLIFEFSNPGLGVPGVVGALCLLLALYAFQVLPVSYAGLALMALGVGLMTAEAFAPSFGVLGLGGIVAFVVGSIILMDTDLPGYQIAMPLIVAFAAFSAGLLIFALGMVFRARRQQVVSGMEHILGETAVVESFNEDEPLVRLEGELWQARSDTALVVNDMVEVSGVDGLTLIVQKKQE